MYFVKYGGRLLKRFASPVIRAKWKFFRTLSFALQR